MMAAPMPGKFQSIAGEARRDRAPRLDLISSSALMAKTYPPLKWVVPGVLVEGCTLLAGRPKIGKSWLVLDMAVAVACGSRCLGDIQCDPGDVLYLALEDNERRLQDRLRKVLPPDAKLTGRLDLAIKSKRANEGGIDAIRTWVREVPKPRLVIIDVLAQFRSPAGNDKATLYEADYGAVKTLQELAADAGTAVLVVTHTRKGMAADDPFEMISGTLGLAGAADSAIILDRDSNGCTLKGRGRDIEEFDKAVEFVASACRWRILGEAHEVRRSDERGEILAALDDADGPLSPAEIASAVGKSAASVNVTLGRMVKAGELEKQGRGKYVLPGRS
jgi:hypothetical protein